LLDPVQPLTPNEPTFNSYTPKDSNCISNALTIPLQLPSRQEMEQLAQVFLFIIFIYLF